MPFFNSQCFRTCTTGFLLLLAAGLSLHGQERPDAFPQIIGSDDSIETYDQEQATIERALRDFEEGGLEQKAGALMLLGKYRDARAQEALRQGLEHDEARIRRAALVSVLEQNASLIPYEDVRRMLPMLGDDDVEIRRQISSVLSRLATSWRIGQSQDRDRRRDGIWPEGMRDRIVEAFRDDDVTVRRNMLENYTAFSLTREVIPLLLERIADEDRQVRLHALRQAGQLAPSAELLEAVAEIPVGEDRLWDRELARQLVHHAHNRDARSLLEQLRESDDRRTRIEAEISHMLVFSEHIEASPAFELLQQENVPADPVRRALRGFFRMDRDEAAHLTTRLFGAESSVVREEALRLWNSLNPPLPSHEVLLDLLHDDAPEVRDTTLRILRNREDEIGTQLLSAMVESPDRDVRQAVFPFLDKQDNDTLSGLLMPLLIDEHVALRERALYLIGKNQTRRWQRILQRSLRDPNPAIQRTAGDWLFHYRDEFPEGLETLAEWVQNHPQSDTAQRYRDRIESSSTPASE